MTPRPIALLLLTALLTTSPAWARPAHAPIAWSQKGPEPGRVLVIEGDGGPLSLEHGRLRATDARVDAIFGRYGFAAARSLTRGPAAAGAPRFLALESARADFDPALAADELRATGRFRAVVPDLSLKLYATFPDDPFLVYQWSIDTPTAAHIHLPDAWDIEQGSPSVVIGIMDTGVDTGHPDLAAQIWTNPGEIPGNSLDDDGNGYVDDVQGWDFGNDDNDANPHAVIDTTGLDAGFHGTFVAGIASAATNNGEGIAGAGWNCRILPLKVVDATGDIPLSAVTAAFDYAGRMGVGVLNLSFGTKFKPGVPEYFQALVDAATDAGVVCVAAAGNDTSDAPSYPAACANVLSVAATDENEERAFFSNYGDWVDVAAPGAGMFSALCRNYEIDILNQLFYIIFFGWDGANPYMFGDGTSFACPLTAGVCGLVRSRYPTWPPQTVIQHVIATGDAITYDFPIGRKVNAFAAVNDAVTAVPRSGAGALQLGRAFPNPFVGSTTVSLSLARPSRVRVAVYDCGGRRLRDLADADWGAGPHDLRWDGADAHGQSVGSGIYFIRAEVGGSAATRRIALLR